MPPRKHRIPVVLDTNVLVRGIKARDETNPNRRIVRLWLMEKRIQLVVSDEVVAEYTAVLSEVLRLPPRLVGYWQSRFTTDPRSTHVNLGPRYANSRDPDDNVLLATALVGRARYLVTNDRDLLEIPRETQRAYPFRILTPLEFLADMG